MAAHPSNSVIKIPKVTEQPPSVEFIQNHLPEYHTAFNTDLCTYDSQLARFVSRPTILGHGPLHDGDLAPSIDPVLSPRELMPAAVAMKFWTQLLPLAMKELNAQHTEPKILANGSFGIRGQGDWQGIQAQLQAARERYDGKMPTDFTEKLKTGYRKVYRKVADNSEVSAKVLVGLLDQDLVSPVKAIVNVIVTSIRKAGSVRDQVREMLDGDELEKRFEDIEIFLSEFQGDGNIEKASVKLLVAVLAAVEGTMGFFMSRQARRITKALLDGDDYQKPLLGLLGEVDSKSRDLIREAERSDTVGTRQGMTRILQGLGKVVSLESTQGIRTELVLGQVESIRMDIADVRKQWANFEAALMNRVNHMFIDGARQRVRDSSHSTDSEMALHDQETTRLELEKWQGYETLRLENKELSQRLAIQERQIHSDAVQHSSAPAPTQHWQPPTYSMMPAGTYYWTSPPQFAPQLHPQLRQQGRIAPTQVQLPTRDIRSHDIDFIMDSVDSLSGVHRSMVGQIVGSRQFVMWAKSCDSQRLLIEDNYTTDLEAADALRWFSALLAKTLHLRAEVVSIVFFCGLHTESDDENHGLEPMMRSLTSQLLRQMVTKFDIDLTEMVPYSQTESNLPDLLRNFERVAKRIPTQGTLVCILDGINHYENAVCEDDLLGVLRFFIGLTQDDGMLSATKLLATSATKTIAAHKPFVTEQDVDGDDDLCLLAFTELPLVGGDVEESDLMVEWT